MNNKEIFEKVLKEVREEGNASVEDYDEFCLQFSENDIRVWIIKTIELKDTKRRQIRMNEVLKSKLKRLEILTNKNFFMQTIGDAKEIEELKKEIEKIENALGDKSE